MNENAPETDRIPDTNPATETIPAAPEHPILAFTDADLEALLRRVVRVTGALGVAVALVLWPAMGWQTAALFAVGAAISIGSIYEWGRLFRTIAARMDGKAVAGFGTGVGRIMGSHCSAAAARRRVCRCGRKAAARWCGMATK